MNRCQPRRSKSWQSVSSAKDKNILNSILYLLDRRNIFWFLFCPRFNFFLARSLFVFLVKSYRFAKISSGLADMLNYSFETLTNQELDASHFIKWILLSGNCLIYREERVPHGGGEGVTVWGVETLTASACKGGGLHATTNGLIPSAWTTTLSAAALP